MQLHLLHLYLLLLVFLLEFELQLLIVVEYLRFAWRLTRVDSFIEQVEFQELRECFNWDFNLVRQYSSIVQRRD